MTQSADYVDNYDPAEEAPPWCVECRYWHDGPCPDEDEPLTDHEAAVYYGETGRMP